MKALVALTAALVLSACAQPPTKELEIAAARIAAAEDAGAALFAPERLGEATRALREAERLTKEDHRYREALRLAGTCVLHADAAFTETVAEKRVIARHLDRAFKELEGLLAIARSRGATEDAVTPYRVRLDALRETASRGDLLEALDGARALELEALAFEQRFRQ